MKFLQSAQRVESFSDGIFALAATLTVLDFSMDNLDYLGTGFWSNFLSFGVAFAVLVILWKTHYNFFRRTDYIDNWIIAENGLLLFVVIYYQFPLRELIRSILKSRINSMEELSSLFISYGIGFILIFLSIAMMYHRNLVKNRGGNSLVYEQYYRHFMIFVLTGAISILLAYFQIGITIGLPGCVYALLGPLCTWNARVFKKRTARGQDQNGSDMVGRE